MTKAAVAKGFLMRLWSDGSYRSKPDTPGSTLIQEAWKDPGSAGANNRDAYFNGASVLTTPQHFGLSQAGYFDSDTKSGNTLVCIATTATDWNTNDSDNTHRNEIHSCSDPVNGPWDLGITIFNSTDANCQISIYVKRNASPLLKTSWSGVASVGAGGVLTLGAGSGPFRLGQKILSAHTPAATATGGEVVVVSKLSGTLGASGSTYQLCDGIGSTTFSSEAMTTMDFVNVTRAQYFSFTDYPAQYLSEWFGTDNSSIYCSGHNDAPGSAGTGNVSTGTISAPSQPGVLIALGFNGGLGGNFPSGPYAPDGGSGYTASKKFVYDEASALGTTERQHFSSVGSRAGLFNSVEGANHCSAGIVLLDA